MNKLFITTAAIAIYVMAVSPAINAANPDISFVLDGLYLSDDRALSEREKGFGIGHTELSFSGNVDQLFSGRLTTVLESHEGETELELEEAFINTIALPAGLDIRAGRFLSQVGYLNAQHTHGDHFSERPAVYRAMLGAHYFDDGIRVNALLLTPFYWRVGAEVFKGEELAGGEGDESVGVYTLSSKWGSDFSDNSSWQFGLAYLRHRLTVEEEHEDDEEEHDHDHGHSHSASYSGENTYIVDAVWKWAPTGNAKNRQVILSGEYLYSDDLNEYASDDDVNEGWYASMVYRFHPQWAVGFRYGEVELKEAHDDHFHDQSLEEADVMLSWSPSHFSTVRLQYSSQEATGFDNANDTVTLQYVMTLGAHGAHAF